MGTGIGFSIKPVAKQSPSLDKKIELGQTENSSGEKAPEEPTTVTEVLSPPRREKVIELGARTTISDSPLKEEYLPDQPTSAEYEEIPVSEFAAALRRGVKDKQRHSSASYGISDSVPRRNNLAGIGSSHTSSPGEVELPIKKHKINRDDK